MSISQKALKDTTREWECLGPISSGGTVYGVAVSPVADVPRYWAATGCGVFSSDDEGETWKQNLSGLTTPLLSALAVAPNGALFAGSLSGDLFSSYDYGANWEDGLVAPEYRATVTAIVTSPNFMSDGTTFAATDGGGLLVCRSAGRQWEDSSFGLGDETVIAVATTPDWSQQEVMFASTTEGVFISRNGGRAWRETELLLDDDVVDILAVSPNYDRDRTVYAGTEEGRIYCSTNGGRAWDVIEVSFQQPINCLCVTRMGEEALRLVAGIGQTLQVSDDGGATWQIVAELAGPALCLAGSGDTLLAGLYDGGVFKSADAGLTWADISQNLAARGFAHLVSTKETLYAMGPQEGLWSSQNSGRSWQPLAVLSEYLPLSALQIPGDDNLLISSQNTGLLRSVDGGATWDIVLGESQITAVLMAPDGQSGWVGTGDGRLFSTADGGANWQGIESPCEGQQILELVASPEFAGDQALLMGTSIPAKGSRGARVALWRSTTAGRNWRQLTTQDTDAQWVDIAVPLGVTEQAVEQAVLATGPFCLRPLRRAKDVWISTRVDPKGANTLSVVSVGEIDQGGTLYAATGNGVYRSTDGGRTWHLFSEGLTDVSFIGLLADQAEDVVALYALSLGGRVWRLMTE